MIFKSKNILKDKEGHFIMRRSSINQKDILIIKVYTPNNRDSEYTLDTQTWRTFCLVDTLMDQADLTPWIHGKRSQKCLILDPSRPGPFAFGYSWVVSFIRTLCQWVLSHSRKLLNLSLQLVSQKYRCPRTRDWLLQGALSPPPGESDPSCGVAGVSTDVQYFDGGWKQST